MPKAVHIIVRVLRVLLLVGSLPALIVAKEYGEIWYAFLALTLVALAVGTSPALWPGLPAGTAAPAAPVHPAQQSAAQWRQGPPPR